MTASISFFEDFNRPAPQPAKARPVSDDAEKKARESFDTGYKQGWDDANAATASEDSKTNADIATALQEAGFAYFEARQHILSSMRPLLEAMVQSILPELARDSLAPRIVEILEQVAAETQPPIQVICPPETAPAFAELAKTQIQFPIEITTEATLLPGQAQIKYDEGMTSIDLEGTVAAIKAAVADFYTMSPQEERASA